MRPFRFIAPALALSAAAAFFVPAGGQGASRSLFNGKDLSHWTAPEGDNGHWKVLDGVIDYDACSDHVAALGSAAAQEAVARGDDSVHALGERAGAVPQAAGEEGVEAGKAVVQARVVDILEVDIEVADIGADDGLTQAPR